MKRLFYSVMTLLLTVAVFVTVAYSWFTNTEFVEPELSGFSISAYFGGGTGTADDPFQIKNERHLYNLAWLQYLGYFNKVGTLDSDGRYDNTDTTKLTQYSFVLSTNITSNKIEYLPPIGTSEYPFIGTLNGNGYTVTGFTTTNRFSDFGRNCPSSVVASGATGNQKNYEHAEIIGFVGAIGKIESMEDYDLYISSSSVSLTNMILNNCSVDTYTDTTLIGSVVGYVNGSVSDIGVKNPTLNLYSNKAIRSSTIQDLATIGNKTTSNLSDYTVAGYAEATYYTATTVDNTIIYNPTTTYSHFNFTGMGNQRDWGGSINFANTYQRIYNIVKGVSSSTNRYQTGSYSYTGKEIQYNKIVNGLVEKDDSKTNVTINTTTFKNKTNTNQIKYYNYGNANGSYLRTDVDPNTNTGDSDQYMTLTALYKDVLIVTMAENPETGFTIKDKSSNYYLNLTSSRVNNDITFNVSLSFNNDESSATVWNTETVSGNTYIYTYSKDDGYKYYLNASTSTYVTSISYSTNNRTVWHKDNETNSFYTLDGSSNRYYLKYYNGSWNLTPLFYLKDSTSNNYIKLSGTTIQNTPKASEATIWYFSNNTGSYASGSIRATSGGANTNNYLRITDGSLAVGSTYTWTNDNTGIYNGTNYIQYKNGYWVANDRTSYKIGSGTNYLSTSLSSTTSDNAALFTLNGNLLDVKAGSGTISIQLATLQYLNYTVNGNDLTLALSNTQTTWYRTGNLIYCVYNDNAYFLQYESGWVLTKPEFYVYDENNNYLSIDSNGNICNYSTGTTLWEFTKSYPISSPAGYISCMFGNNKYYLSTSNTDLILSSNNTTEWFNEKTGLYCLIDGAKHYLVYNSSSGNWELSTNYYTISYNNSYMNVDNSGNIVSNNYASSQWEFIELNNNYINIKTKVNGTNYYLELNSDGVLVTTTNSNEATSFKYQNDKLFDSNNNYIQLYNNKWICAKAFNIKYNNSQMRYNGSISTGTGVWFYYSSNDTPQGYIYTVYNGTIYYLYSNGTTLTCNTTNKTNWQRDEYGLYLNSNGNKYIIYENNTWKVAALNVLTAYYIRSGTTYLSSDSSGNIVTTKTTPWVFATTGNNPSGVAYTIDSNGTTRYMVDGGDYVATSTTTTTTSWTNNNGGLQVNNRNRINLYSSTWYCDRDAATTLTFEPTSLLLSPLATTENVNTYTNISVESTSSIAELFYDLGNLNNLSIDSVIKTTIASKIDKNELITASESLDVYSRKEYFDDDALPSLYSAIPLTTKGDLQQTVPSDYSTSNYYVTDDTNTGYIISGGHEPRKSADVRISYFNQTGNNYTGMPSALIGGSYSNSTIGNVYTVTQSGIATLITDDMNFQKYAASKSALQKTLSSSSKLYGVHFMNAPISIDKYVTVDEVLINGETKTNYQMPEDCIDFQLAAKGYINFFSSYFYYNTSDGGANNCFFSLHEVFRASNNKISQIRHILQVYVNNDGTNDNVKDGTYVYYYEDDSDTSVKGYYYYDASTETYKNDGVDFDFNLANYTLKFDSSWIEDPANSKASANSRQNFYGTNGANNGNKLFYFEIPVNKGEYALGSVSKTDYDGNVYNGAYIMYLDIGTNAAVIDRTEITQKSVTTVSDYKYVNGIQILDADSNATGSSISALDSTVAIIPASASNMGELTVSRTDIDETSATITFSQSVDSTYKGDGITLNGATLKTLNGTGNGETTVRNVLKRLDYHRTNDKLYQTTVYNNGTANTSYEVYEVDKTTFAKVGNTLDYNGMSNREAATYGLIEITNNGGVPSSVRNDSWTNLTINPSTVIILNYKFDVNTADKAKISETIIMNFAKVTSDDTVIVNLDPNVSDYTVTNGHVELYEEQYNTKNFVVENIYKLTGNDAIVTFDVDADDQVEIIVVEVNDGTGSYTFKINDVTVANNAEYSTVVPQA